MGEKPVLKVWAELGGGGAQAEPLGAGPVVSEARRWRDLAGGGSEEE